MCVCVFVFFFVERGVSGLGVLTYSVTSWICTFGRVIFRPESTGLIVMGFHVSCQRLV